MMLMWFSARLANIDFVKCVCGGGGVVKVLACQCSVCFVVSGNGNMPVKDSWAPVLKFNLW